MAIDEYLESGGAVVATARAPHLAARTAPSWWVVHPVHDRRPQSTGPDVAHCASFRARQRR